MIHIVADPDELGQLYRRCIRCMYLRYRRNKDVGSPPGREVAASIVGYHAEGDWIALPQTARFRFRTFGERAESRAVKYADAGVTLGFAGRYDALLELEDGTVVLVKCTDVANESAAKVHQWGLGAYAFALQHPRTTRVEPIAVGKLAVLELGVTPAPGGRRNVVVPKRLNLLERNDDRFGKWAGVVARLLGTRQAPRETCSVCKDLPAT